MRRKGRFPREGERTVQVVITLPVRFRGFWRRPGDRLYVTAGQALDWFASGSARYAAPGRPTPTRAEVLAHRQHKGW